MGDPDLARYQAALMSLLARKDIDDDERMRLLREGPAFAPYASYVETFERPFVSLGASLLDSYGRRSGRKRKR